ncbi:HAD-IA family hydrolase [Streptomyces sp. NBC_01190]|uniref:HAD-IA family hydrolase n=1 Tax=Streptomyces sp. NBC_01190 TaxID=2903767 RepID=UPI00386EB341|nr:HAD-IA family hydrolase [Streptomyces sp. NBC_01190]
MNRGAGLILDFGGVLTTSFTAATWSFDRRSGLPEGTFLSVVTGEPAGQALWEDVERGAISQTRWSEGTATLLGVGSTDLVARLLADLRPEPSVIAAARAARAAGVTVGVLSNSLGTEPFDIYAGYDLAANYDPVVISGHHGLRKPDPEIYRLTLDLMELPAEACVFVDDTEANLPPARALGITSVLTEGPADTLAAIETALAMRSAP